ncbi:MAG: nucleotidyltransferase family protein [Candidatus Omnitrophica bacterium]|nr:nucleotidyltransferase family protein [Candidatus Omnitrophota bacterium]
MLTKKKITKNIKRNSERIESYGVKSIGIFGSFAKSRQKKTSDIDVLVEFKRGMKTFDNYMELKFFLQKLLHHKVDLVIKDALKPKLKPYVIKEVKYAGL